LFATADAKCPTKNNNDTTGGSTKFRKSGILVEFADLAFHLNAPGDLTDEEADNILDFLHQHNVEQEKSQLYQLNCVFQSLLRLVVSLSVSMLCQLLIILCKN